MGSNTHSRVLTSVHEARRGPGRPRTEEEGTRGFCLRMPPSLKAYVKREAERRGITMTAVICEAIAEHNLLTTGVIQTQ